MHEIVRMGSASVRVLKDASDTDGRFSMVELNMQPGGSIFGAHVHLDCDQTVIGVEGLAVWTVNAEKVVVGPGEQIVIPRGTPHNAHNRQGYPARSLCIFSPAQVTGEYFEGLSKAFDLSEEERQAQIGATLARFRTLPVLFRN